MEWRTGNNELSEHVMYYMQTVLHALCRHVPKSGLQGEGGIGAADFRHQIVKWGRGSIDGIEGREGGSRNKAAPDCFQLFPTASDCFNFSGKPVLPVDH